VQPEMVTAVVEEPADFLIIQQKFYLLEIPTLLLLAAVELVMQAVTLEGQMAQIVFLVISLLMAVVEVDTAVVPREMPTQVVLVAAVVQVHWVEQQIKAIQVEQSDMETLVQTEARVAHHQIPAVAEEPVRLVVGQMVVMD
jgi:hypothetical protein